jgi:hypothetical protein
MTERIVDECGETKPLRDHIFISYAWEDRIAADWLTLRLTAAGYRVWCDRFKMLGGERFPEDIDRAIKKQTFRMLGLLSQKSLHRDNPVAERTLALAMGKERGIDDFYVPLALEPLAATDLPWMISGVTYIPFADWADGLRRLLKKLTSINAPRGPETDGYRAVSDALAPVDIVLQRPETVFTNCFRFRTIPETLHVFEREGAATGTPDALADLWPFHKLDDTHVVAFTTPPVVHGVDLACRQSVAWREVSLVDKTPTRHIVSNLLRQAVRTLLLNRGLKEDKKSFMIHFPTADRSEVLKLPFVQPDGRKEDVQATGGRHFTDGTSYCYHLAPTFRIRGDMGPEFWAQLTVRVHVTGADGSPFDTRAAFSRRRHLTSGWFNHQWLTRQMAVMNYLAAGVDVLRVGQADGLIEIESTPLTGTIESSINDKALRVLRGSARPVSDVIDDDHDEERDGDE